MKTYTEWKDEKEKEINAIPLGFAFGKDQFLKMLERMGLTEDNCKDNLYSLGGGGYIKKTDSHLLKEFHKKYDGEWEEFKKNEQFMYEAFRYELANHEYCITYNYEDTLDCLDLTEDEVVKNPMLVKALSRATKDYLKDMERFN